MAVVRIRVRRPPGKALSFPKHQSWSGVSTKSLALRDQGHRTRGRGMRRGTTYWLISFLAAGSCGCQRPSSHSPRQGHSGTGQARAVAANQRGLDYVTTGADRSAAETSFREAIAADPLYAAAHCNLGNVLCARGAWSEAMRAYRSAVQLAPEAVEPRVGLGRLYGYLGWYREAAVELEHALRLAPDNEAALGHLAYVQVQMNGNADGLRALLARLARGQETTPWRAWAVAQLGQQGQSPP